MYNYYNWEKWNAFHFHRQCNSNLAPEENRCPELSAPVCKSFLSLSAHLKICITDYSLLLASILLILVYRPTSIVVWCGCYNSVVKVIFFWTFCSGAPTCQGDSSLCAGSEWLRLMVTWLTLFLLGKLLLLIVDVFRVTAWDPENEVSWGLYRATWKQWEEKKQSRFRNSTPHQEI